MWIESKQGWLLLIITENWWPKTLPGIHVPVYVNSGQGCVYRSKTGAIQIIPFFFMQEQFITPPYSSVQLQK